MDFTTLAKSRYSCRKYKEEKPSHELLMNVLGTARLAPSAANRQPWKLIVVEEPDQLDRIKSTYGRTWIQSAPVVIAVCGDHGSVWVREDDRKDHTDIDAAIITDHLTLSATESGLATCWICRFDSVKAAEILNVPAPWEVIALLPIGFPADEPDINRHERLRKKMEEIVSFNQF